VKPNYTAIALEFIRAHPGASGLEITDELMRRSRAARWFGAESILAAMFGPGTGTAYAILDNLENAGRVYSVRGNAIAERPRHYYAKRTAI
jgi:hypothetical protein